MAVNSFNPRLFSSSENDVEEVYRHKGGSVAPVGGNLATAKTRCFSEPVSQSGKDGKKEDSKVFGKAPALSDSSNFLSRQKGRTNSSTDSENPSGNFMKSECSPIFEEVSQLSSPSANSDKEKSAIDIVFPEPESNREAIKIALLMEDEESMDGMIPGRDTPNDTTLGEFDEDLNNDDVSNDVFYLGEVTFSSTDIAALRTEDQQLFEDDDDESYPEKESIPSGYAAFAAQDLPYASCPWDLPRTVRASYADLDLDKLPELPDDLIKENTVFPGDFELHGDFDDLSPALVPTSIFAPPNCELKMKLVFGKTY